MTHANRPELGRLPSDMLVLTAWFCMPLIVVVGSTGATWATTQPRQAAMFSLGCLVLGAISLFVSRLPLYRQGRFWVVGERQLPPAARPWYRLAYWLIIPNVVFLLLLYLTLA